MRLLLSFVGVVALLACDDPRLDRRGTSAEACDPDRIFSGDRPGTPCDTSTTCQAFCCDCSVDGPSQVVAFCGDGGFCADDEATCARLTADDLTCATPVEDAEEILDELP